MGDENPPDVDVGDRVTYIDGDGAEHNAVVVSPVSDAPYITAVVGDSQEIGEEYVSRTETETSVWPHPDEWDNAQATEEYSFKVGWS